jgi:hypothetical protein
MRLDQLPWAPRYDDGGGHYFDMCSLLVDGQWYYLERSTGLNDNYPEGTMFIGHADCRKGGVDSHKRYWRHLCPLAAQAVIFHLLAGEVT